MGPVSMDHARSGVWGISTSNTRRVPVSSIINALCISISTHTRPNHYQNRPDHSPVLRLSCDCCDCWPEARMDIPSASPLFSFRRPSSCGAAHSCRSPPVVSFSAVSLQLSVNQTWPGSSCIPEAALHTPGSMYGQALD